MKRYVFLFFLILFLTGCATYKFHHGKEPYEKGYVASRDDYTVLEYTVGNNNSVPDIKLAKERFLRRRRIVEHYYKKMGLIENHFKMAFLDPLIYTFKLIGGIFRLPSVAISDYKYEHNPQYKEKIKEIEQKKDEREEARISGLKKELNSYIQQDLKKEGY